MKTQNDSNNVMTESTAVKTNPEDKEKNGLSPVWQSVLIGGIPGIMIGAVGTMGAEAVANTPDNELSDVIEEAEEVEILEAHSVTDDMTFSEAFAAARAEVGPGGAFVWHGQVYGTYRADDPEWLAMSDEERAEHSHEILSHVHATPYAPVENDDTDDVEVHILGVGDIETSDGSVAQIGVGLVNDHSAVFADTDGDDVVDTVMIDSNNNNHFEPSETYDARITMDDLRDAMGSGIADVTDLGDCSCDDSVL